MIFSTMTSSTVGCLFLKATVSNKERKEITVTLMGAWAGSLKKSKFCKTIDLTVSDGGTNCIGLLLLKSYYKVTLRINS